MTTQRIDGRTREGRAVTRGDNTGRPNRVPVGAANKLAVYGQDPNYVYRWVNDKDDRLAMFRQAGYEFCHNEERAADKGVNEGSAVDTRIMLNAGRGMKSYLMRIPREFYDEDQARKMEAIKVAEDQMRNRNPNPRKGEYQGLSDE